MAAPPPNPALFHPVYLKDIEIGASYVEFPEDVIFMEALAKYGGTGRTLVPVQREDNDGKKTSHIYEFTVGMETAKHLCGPLPSPDGNDQVTIFGCACTNDGILYVCAFNRNSILALDLKNDIQQEGRPIKAFWEIPDLPAPNDMCIDWENEDSLMCCVEPFQMLYEGLSTS